MKKEYSLFLMSLIVILLAACGNGESDEVSAESEEKTKIEYWHVNAETQGGNTVDQLVEEFNAQSDTVEVVARYNPDMYAGLMSNMQAEVASGNSPAVVQVGWAFLDYFSENFEYVEPQEVIENYHEEDVTFLEDNFLPNILELGQNAEGTQVGIPYSLSNPILYINKDMLQEAGLDSEGPETLEEVREYSEAINKATGNYGVYIQEIGRASCRERV